MMMHRTDLLGLFCCLALVGSAHGQSIDTFPSWNGVNDLDRWGAGGDTPTFGQSFTATPALNNLSAMTFSLARTMGATTIEFQAYVFAWNGSDVTGSALYVSGNQVTPDSSSHTQVTVNTGGVALTPGQQYVAFFSTNGLSNPTAGYDWGMQGVSVSGAADVYSGGKLVFNNDTSTLFAGNWTDASGFGATPDADFAFRLDFAAVPEPTTIAMVGLVLTGVGLRVWRGNKQRKSK